MSVHFAAARCPARSPLARAFSRQPVARAANDNGQVVTEFDDTIRAALTQFAEHGLASVANAVQQAERAQAAGDSGAMDHWLAICRSFDPRRADLVARRLSQAGHYPFA